MGPTPKQLGAGFKVTQMRALFEMQPTKLNGYLITSFDQHSSEYVADFDRRLQFLTGFTGSVGKAIVTETDARLWVDGRYYIQASEEIQSPFQLMKSGSPGVPSEWEWLVNTVPAGGIIGVCDMYVPSTLWTFFKEKLDSSGVKLVNVTSDLVELLWTDRPVRPSQEIVPHPIIYSGQRAGEKVSQIREEMRKNNATLLVLTELDDIAWLLNLRGRDIPYNPVFFSFLIVGMNHIDIFADGLNESVLRQLFVEKVSMCDHEYEEFYDALEAMTNYKSVGKIWISNKANQRVRSMIPKNKVFVGLSPVSVNKCVKNNAEASGMIEAHVYDGHALCKFFCWVDRELKQNHPITEMSAADKLEEIKRLNRDYIGPSFQTISASGPHSAIVHYHPSSKTDRPLSLNEVYLCDSGSQYSCGTTDVTRTYHFGSPSEFQKKCYTNVFKGQVSLSTAVFPENTKGPALDVLARQHLWVAGLDYNHGTGHGVGAHLNVHEGPIGITRDRVDEIGLKANMFLSNEPGYYEQDSFGIRLENVENLVKAVPNNENSSFLTFENITLCPYQKSMLIPSMLTANEINYLNSYHARIRNILGPVFKCENNKDVTDWLFNMTEELNP